MFRKTVLSILLAALCLLTAWPASAEVPDNIPFDVNAESAVLMEVSTGEVLYAKNADRALPPASVTKIMTLVLFMEEVDAGNIALDE
ncbi:MAG: serine hydrolase, partial [Clostridia bacterium]|nr:serine hydrolase [Clostridia bacterium]